PEVVALARALTHAREHGQTAMLTREVSDELRVGHGLAGAGAAEQPDLTATGEGGDQVHDLDARLEHLGRGLLLGVVRGGAVDWPAGRVVRDWLTRIDRGAGHVEDPAERHAADGHA